MSVTMHFYKKANIYKVDSTDFIKQFYKINLIDESVPIELSYSVRKDFCDIYKTVTNEEFPTLEESYNTKKAAESNVISYIDMFNNIAKVINETDGLRKTGIEDLDIAYMQDLFKTIVKRINYGYSIIIDYA